MRFLSKACIVGAAMASLMMCGLALAGESGPTFKSADIGHGITLHYAEQGTGQPLILIHGSLSDYSYWRDQIGPLAKHYRVIAYSRRYNYPNKNPAQPGYSAITDADDLAALISTLHLGRVYVIGHSYGALTTLFMASRHPELLKAVVLAEAPLVPLLCDLSGSEAAEGISVFADIQRRMVLPMRAAFAKGDREQGVATFINYVFADPMGWQKMSRDSQAGTLRDAHEWDVMLTTGTLFPALAPADIRAIKLPVLIMSGGKSYTFLGLIDRELARLLPDNRHVMFLDAGHQMWLQHPDEARDDSEKFFQAHP